MADDGPNPKSSSSSMTSAAPRPTIALPPRSTFESLFRGGVADVSPGPLTLVSNFFADDPDGDCRSFSQLLAGAMASPAAARREAAMEEVKDEEERPLRMAPQSQSPSPFFMVPAGLSPGGLLESPAVFSNNLGPFGMSHQQVLAQVTAQAAQSHAHMHIQPEFPSSHSLMTASLSQPIGSAPINMASFQQMHPPTSTANNSFRPENVTNFDQRSQPPSLIVDKPVDDGYNWRKYGEKRVKGSEYHRSYYKCTLSNCPVRKKVERSLEGQVKEIIYKGQHNHQKPQSNKRGKDNGSMMINRSNELSGYVDYAANSETISQGGSFKRERESGQGTSEQLSGSSDGEEVGDTEIGTNHLDDTGPDPKRSKIVEVKAAESTSSRTVTEPKIIVQTTSEVDLLDDGYRWRKYGQKVVKGNPHPRSYYKCTFTGCNVRKHVERASTDPKAVITAYEGKHNHDVPAARNSSHNTAAANSRVHIPIPHNQALFKRQDFGNNVDRPIAVLQFKEEHEMP